ncbi:hypothetical protein [Streptosporangium sp. H16]|uniref:hypothetical protein n=1 Tax=Streptosporangium sp. H16 TaxID=3444184 RepID=UPI003F7A0B51
MSERRTPGPGTPDGTGRPRRATGEVRALPEQPPSVPPDPPPSRQASGAVRVLVRFETASAALVFAEQLSGGRPIGTVGCARGGPGDHWWVRSDLPLEVGREMAAVCSGRLHVLSGDRLVPDAPGREAVSGASPARAGLTTLGDLVSVSVTDLVRRAGLHPARRGPLREAVLLLPGHLVPGVVRRALDLRLRVEYRPVALTPLFEGGTAERISYEVRLRAARETAVPGALLAALGRDPSVLVCRSVEETLLVQHGTGTPLSDRSLATLVDDGVWVLAGPGYGCSRLRPLAEAAEGAALVRRGEDHTLPDIGPASGHAQPYDAHSEPAPRTLTLVRAPTRGVAVDAALLDDADLECLPRLLAGEQLSESAFLVRGRDRHLLTAPGGLLEHLPVGEPLHCVGPGGLYVPLGRRIDPLLPATARGALFPTDSSTALVLLASVVLAFDLETRLPVWRLWAGPVPPLDEQLPRSVAAELRDIDEQVTPTRPQSPARRPSGWDRVFNRRPRDTPPDWRDEAYAAERAGQYAVAAELYSRNNDPLRAARLYERAAEES